MAKRRNKCGPMRTPAAGDAQMLRSADDKDFREHVHSKKRRGTDRPHHR